LTSGTGHQVQALFFANNPNTHVHSAESAISANIWTSNLQTPPARSTFCHCHNRQQHYGERDNSALRLDNPVQKKARTKRRVESLAEQQHLHRLSR